MRSFRFRSILYSERCAQLNLSSALSKFKGLAENIRVFFFFEPIFSLRVHDWIKTTVSQLAGESGCRRKRQLSFLYNVFLLM